MILNWKTKQIEWLISLFWNLIESNMNGPVYGLSFSRHVGNTLALRIDRIERNINISFVLSYLIYLQKDMNVSF